MTVLDIRKLFGQKLIWGVEEEKKRTRESLHATAKMLHIILFITYFVIKVLKHISHKLFRTLKLFKQQQIRPTVRPLRTSTLKVRCSSGLITMIRDTKSILIMHCCKLAEKALQTNRRKLQHMI